MNLIEVTYPEGTLDEIQRQAIADAIIASLLVEPDAPQQAIERAGRATHIWFHAAQTWTTGAAPNATAHRHTFVVTITVPEAWRDELSQHAIGAVRTALARHVPTAFYEDAAVWINLVGVHEGSIGMNGRPSISTDIVRYLTQGIEPPNATELPDGVVIDPVCGMSVHIGPNTLTLIQDGQTIGFCAGGCRSVYAQDHGIPIDA